MPFLKGSKHSPETREKMSASRSGKPHSEERKAKISAANTGKTREPRYRTICVCGIEFLAATSNAIYHSPECRRGVAGHGLRHAPAFKHFKQECGICGAVDELVGDHDHRTGRARGILCRKCNLALGNMDDMPSRLRAAANYLEIASSRPAVYLAGPMSGMLDCNYPAFHAEARRLRDLGYHVENPAENPPPPGRAWAGYMRMAIAQLVTCHAIAVLPGWRRSRGASLEVGIAQALEMPVHEAAALTARTLEAA